MVEQGIHPGMGMSTYHDWKLDKANLIEGPISCSVLKDFDANPYAWLKSPEKKQTEAMRTGSLFDAALTDPKELVNLVTKPDEPEACVILPFPDRRTKAAKEWIKEAEARGERVITEKEREAEVDKWTEQIAKADEQLDRATKAALAVRNHKVAGSILEGAQFQVGVVGEVGGIPAKCLIDILPHEDSEWCETIVDYKTTSWGLSDEAIRKAIGSFKYHWQGGFYRTHFNKVSEDRVCEDVAFIFQDVNTDEVRVIQLSSDALSLGTRAVKRAVEGFVRCAHQGIKSRYRSGISTLDLMPYHAMSEEEDLDTRES